MADVWAILIFFHLLKLSVSLRTYLNMTIIPVMFQVKSNQSESKHGIYPPSEGNSRERHRILHGKNARTVFTHELWRK